MHLVYIVDKCYLNLTGGYYRSRGRSDLVIPAMPPTSKLNSHLPTTPCGLGLPDFLQPIVMTAKQIISNSLFMPFIDITFAGWRTIQI
jgi:hypothetical protein